jgi:two-component system, NtrC family, sensor kinase
MSDVLDLVACKATEVLDAHGALVRVINLETQHLEFCAAFGLDAEYLAKGPATDTELIAKLCERNEVVIIDDILHDPRVQCQEEAWSEGIRMMLDAPLIVQRPLVGILRMHFAEQRQLGQIEMNFMISIAEQCASAIDKAWLIETQRDQFDQLALQTEKLSALGRMAAGIAHEVNNPLAGILLYSSHLSKKIEAGNPVKEGLEIITREAKRCRDIMQNLLEFSRHNEPKKSVADVNEVVDRAISITENEFNLRHITLNRFMQSNLPQTLLDSNQIEQVFVNLLLNAAEATSAHDVVTVTTSYDEASQRIVILFEDTGAGILEEHIDHIFEPFYSTKKTGTGLGLSVSYGIIDNHKGAIKVSSHPGCGTRFEVVLPALLADSGPPRARVGSEKLT